MESEDGGGACRLIAINRTLRAECERVLPVLEAAKAPASRAEIIAIVVRNMLTYGISARDSAVHGITWESFADALEGQSAYAVEDAFIRWNRGEGHKDLGMAGFPPRQAQLAILADVGKRTLWGAVYRSRAALAYVEKAGLDWTPERKAAERQKSIDLGYLNPDGTPNISLKPKTMPQMRRPTQSPQQMAAQLRAMAPQEDVGEVI